MANFNPAPGRYVTQRSALPAGAHAMFAAGRGYYAAPHPGLTPPKPAPARPKSQTVSQAANSQVNQQLAPVLASQAQQDKTQNQAIQQFALALLGKLQPIAGQVGQQYDQAIGQTQALSGATADALRNANPNQQDQTMLAAINAPQSQRDQLQNQLANTFGGGAAVGQFLGGEVPGTQLATDKAAAQSQASQLPGIAALKGQQDLTGALTTQRQRRTDTLAQRPALVQQATQNIKGNLQAKAAAAYDQYKFETARNDALVAAGQKSREQGARDQANLDYKYKALNSQNQRAANTIAAQNARASAQITAANTRNQARITAANKRAAKTSKSLPQDKKDYPNLSKTQVVHLRSGIANAFYGIPARKATPNTKATDGQPAVTYQQAITEGVKAGYSRAAATRMADHFYMPGDRGRPKKKP